MMFQTCSGWNCKVKNCCLRYSSLKDNQLKGNVKPLKGSEKCINFVNENLQRTKMSDTKVLSKDN